MRFPFVVNGYCLRANDVSISIRPDGRSIHMPAQCAHNLWPSQAIVLWSHSDSMPRLSHGYPYIQ